MALTVPNTNRTRGTTETVVADQIREVQQYVNRNVPQVPGNAIKVPRAGSRPILPVAK